MVKIKHMVKCLAAVILGIIIATVPKFSVEAATDAYLVKDSDTIYSFPVEQLTQSFLDSKFGYAAPIYSDFASKIYNGDFYAFHDTKNGFIDYNAIVTAYLDNRAAFSLDNFTENTYSKINIDKFKKVSFKDGYVFYEDAQEVNPSYNGSVVATVTIPESTGVGLGQKLVEVAKIKMQATGGDTVIDGIKLTRLGFSSDRDIDRVTAWDGNTRLNYSSIFSSSKADINFLKPVIIKAGESTVIDIKLDIAAINVYAGSQINISIDEIKTNNKVECFLPVTLNTLTLSSVELVGIKYKIPSDKPIRELNPDTKDNVFTKIELYAENEDIKINKVAFTNQGSSLEQDAYNFKLYNGVTQIGKTVEKTKDRKVTFIIDDEILIKRGETKVLTLKGDIALNSCNRSLQFIIDDHSDITGVGQTYGTTLTAINSDPGSLQPALFIKSGGFIISRDLNSAYATTVNNTTTQATLGKIRIEAIGEAMQLTSIDVVIKSQARENFVIDGKNVLSNLKLNIDGTTIGSMYDMNFIEDYKTDDSGEICYKFKIMLSNQIIVYAHLPVILDISADLNHAPKDVTYTVGLGSQAISARAVASGTNIISETDQVFARTITTNNTELNVTRIPREDLFVYDGQQNVPLIDFNISHNVTGTVHLSTLRVTMKVIFTTNLKLIDKNGNIITDVIPILSGNNTVIQNGQLLYYVDLIFKNPLIIAPNETVKLTLVSDISGAATGELQFGIAEGSVARQAINGSQVYVTPLAVGGAKIKLSLGGAVITAVDNSLKAGFDGQVFKNVSIGERDVKVACFTITEGGKDKAGNNVGKEEASLVREVYIKNAAKINPMPSYNYKNIRITDSKGNILGFVDNLNDDFQTTKIVLNKPLEIQPDNSADINVIVDIDSSAKDGAQIQLQLGDCDGNTVDIKYASKYTGKVGELKTAGALSTVVIIIKL